MKPWLLTTMLFVLAAQCFASRVAITTATLPNGTINTAYAAVINASGGCTPYKWAIASGTLPTGVTTEVSISTKSLTFVGTPTHNGTYSFAEKVTGCGGFVSQASYEIVIQATPVHVVDLTWEASTTDDVVGYNIYRSPDGTTWATINASVIASPLYNDATVANGTTYYYAVTAVDSYGRESTKTNPVKAVVP